MPRLRKLAKLLLACLYLIPSLFPYLLRVRFLVISHPDRIGHLAAEPDCFLKEAILGACPRVNAVLLLDPARSANPCLAEYWATRIRTIRGAVSMRLLAPFVWFPYLRARLDRYLVAIDDTAAFPAIQARWLDRKPLLSLTESHARRGEQCLETLGVQKGAWFVCVHSREGGFSPKDEHLHKFRNSDIDSYSLAMQAIVDRGGWCIRMGDPSMKPLGGSRGIVDYAHSEHRSDWMDVFLCARCRFFLGNTSGLCLVSTVFGVRSALANLVPMSTALPLGPADIGIPKLMKKPSGEFAPFAEILGSPAANFRFDDLYKANGLAVVDNSPEEIRELAVEMLDTLEKRIGYSPQDLELQRRFLGLMRPGHYAYGSTSRIGRDFLRKHSRLLPDPAASARPGPPER